MQLKDLELNYQDHIPINHIPNFKKDDMHSIQKYGEFFQITILIQHQASCIVQIKASVTQ